MPDNGLNSIKMRAISVGLTGIAALASECDDVLNAFPTGDICAAEKASHRALDILAKIEAELLSFPLAEDPDFSVSGFLDESFDRLVNTGADPLSEDVMATEEGFEIDEETMDIFRSEASDLLETISSNLKLLSAQPNDRDALWNIRRCAHTFKGAAGVIGLNDASELAHRVEDLLDKLAESQQKPNIAVIKLLASSTSYLSAMTLGCSAESQPSTLDMIYADFDRAVSDRAAEISFENTSRTEGSFNPVNEIPHAATIKPPPAPIVRVALDKLDDLLDLTRNLSANHSSLARRIADFRNEAEAISDETLAKLFDAQVQLTTRLQEKLLQIRMVRFGMLTTRLNRAVHVTCQEEGKKAALMIENEDCEVDTQILDSLVEPLLHLLRNAVAHGIEPPERRRLISKPEKGQIRIQIENKADQLLITVEDDGRGISPTRLREKAVASGIGHAASISSLSDSDTLDLIFLRGLTTADKLSMNAGRGVGMSIVRESIGSIGGSISVASEPQKGTKFTVTIPLAVETTKQSEDELFQHEISPQQTLEKNSLKILVVDDSSSVRQMIKRMAEDEGWQCTTAIDGINAAEILSVSENRPDIILTDLEMPNLDGYELLQLLKNDVELCDIPILMVTSRTDKAHREKALELGAVDFITKPFQAKTLIESVEHHIGIRKT